MSIFFMFLMVTVLVFLYFLPAGVAIARNHWNATPIVLSNILLGWTALGWVAALIWAFTNPPALPAYAAPGTVRQKLKKFAIAVFVLAVLPAAFVLVGPLPQPAPNKAPAVKTGVPVPLDKILGQ